MTAIERGMYVEWLTVGTHMVHGHMQSSASLLREKMIPLETAAFSPESPLLFFLGQNDLYTRRWAPQVGLGEHNPPGRAWAAWHAQVGCAHLVGPLW